jgi:hypothetical protein
MRRCWTVQDRNGVICATFRGHQYKKDFDAVPTACGMVVNFSGGTRRGKPTCKECKKIVMRRRENR